MHNDYKYYYNKPPRISVHVQLCRISYHIPFLFIVINYILKKNPSSKGFYNFIVRVSEIFWFDIFFSRISSNDDIFTPAKISASFVSQRGKHLRPSTRRSSWILLPCKSWSGKRICAWGDSSCALTSLSGATSFSARKGTGDSFSWTSGEFDFDVFLPSGGCYGSSGRRFCIPWQSRWG